ncbi:sulfur carrier protein ThiS [Azospirillum sp. TSO35-2]|uniref:sulfur carrier protein ThiS n=1 Tax=Azospirillum sp. TSO35-2 TaxID=716796 RepID=UPI000D61092D|nr:sulfur carrier protein ThiS [Azospirillum sp. TSO35-2]PWC39303.1 thiamine biosynthesis protein ThiS [Azospirillum sp. TSO35-2]
MSAVLRVNGRDEPLVVDTVAALLAAHGVDDGARGVAVALNGAVLPRRRWADTALQPGDSLEIVRPIQGG